MIILVVLDDLYFVYADFVYLHVTSNDVEMALWVNLIDCWFFEMYLWKHKIAFISLTLFGYSRIIIVIAFLRNI